MIIEELVTALTIGLIGSFHCIGMCGPIALALPSSFERPLTLFISRLLYSLGRIITYGFLGLLVGVLGQAIALAGWQQTLSIVTGSAMILSVILPLRLLSRILPSSVSYGLTSKIKTLWSKLFKRPGLTSLFVIGLLNGLLPCGLVYVAMAAATTTGDVSRAALYMVAFGIGTAPALIITSLMQNLVSLRIRRMISRFLPIGIVILGTLLVLRGLSLGIPYISPQLHHDRPLTEQPCCH